MARCERRGLEVRVARRLAVDCEPGGGGGGMLGAGGFGVWDEVARPAPRRASRRDCACAAWGGGGAAPLVGGGGIGRLARFGIACRSWGVLGFWPLAVEARRASSAPGAKPGGPVGAGGCAEGGRWSNCARFGGGWKGAGFELGGCHAVEVGGWGGKFGCTEGGRAEERLATCALIASSACGGSCCVFMIVCRSRRAFSRC